MVAYLGRKRITPEERSHLAAVKALPCCICPDGMQMTPTECHHLLDGGKRIGHFWVIPLCRLHHAQIHRFRAFVVALWEATNKKLGIEREWVTSKVVPRRVCQL
jgi:hypothetical protein